MESLLEPAPQQMPSPDGSQLDLAGYPAPWEADALLADGGAIRMRPIRRDDEARLDAFHHTLSAESVRLRYFGAHPLLSPAELARLTGVDYRERMAFVATVREDIVGVARYDRLADPQVAEVAFVVSDAYHHRGVGTLLFEHLVAYARAQNIDRLVAEVLPDNVAMIRLVQDSGLPCSVARGGHDLRVIVSTEETPGYLVRRDERERVAVAASMVRLLRPASIAVVGAGRQAGGIGHTIVRNLVTGGFTGAVYPVNPHAKAICGVPAYPNLKVLPVSVDLAVVAVPADAVLAVAGDAADAGVTSLVVVSSGFAEMGAAGAQLQAQLLEIARRNGMRIVGPNCLGVANSDPAISCNATFSPSAPVPGPIALMSQSGALGIMLLEEASRIGLGVSTFVSIGNKLDVSGNDLLCYWESDEATSVIALYVESFGNPRKFARIARHVSSKKPIVALKAGRTPAGARGARSHTASAATPERAVKTLLSSSGVIEVERLEDLLDTVSALAETPLPKGNRVALIGNSGGPLILAADACASSGLVVDELPQPLQQDLSGFLPPISACANPVDITAEGTPAMLSAAVRRALADASVDVVAVVVTAVGALSTAEAVHGALAEAAESAQKPVMACLLGFADATVALGHSAGQRVAYLPSPERVVAALGRACRYGAWRQQAVEDTPEPVIDRRSARALVEGALGAAPAGGWLAAPDAMALLKSCGIECLVSRAVGSARAAREAAEEIGFPVVLKAASGELVHKSEAGGVALDLHTPEELEQAWDSMAAALGDAMGGGVVQPMRGGGIETIVGLSVDASFGPLLMFGLGGTTTNLLDDFAFRVPPLSEPEAAAMVTAIRCAPLLTGYRGSTPVSVSALAEVVRRVGTLALVCPEIVELDLNPVLAFPDKAVVIDAKIRVAPPTPGPSPTMRILRRPAQGREDS